MNESCTNSSSINKQQVSTACDSATNGYSSSSYDALKKNGAPAQVKSPGTTRLQELRPKPISSPREAKNDHLQKAVSETKAEDVSEVPALKLAPSNASLRKEPQLDRENYVSGHLKKFLAHVETREIKKSSHWESAQATAPKSVRSKVSKQSSSERDKSSESEHQKDNEDPTATVGTKADHFDPKELRQIFDGWSLYKKMRISFAPVRRYQYMVDQDYKKNKVTVCAHLQNIFNSFQSKRGKQPHLNNFFDIEKWLIRMGEKSLTKESNSPSKEMRRTNTLAQPLNFEEEPQKRDNFLLAKSNSTAHIPESSRNKQTKRAYANFDKELAVKMFGYRVVF